jgi:hypothetical protein
MMPSPGDRLEFYRTPTGPWQLFNHSTERHPAVYAETSGTLHLFASGATGDRLEFYRTPTGPWQPPFNHRTASSTAR